MPFAEVNGTKLRYEVWGVGTTPVVFIHGLGSSADDWFMQFPALAPGYRCIALDLRGHGLSDKPRGRYTVPLFAADVAALLAALEAAPSHIVGLSLGGMVAQQLGVAHPQVVRSLTLLNTLPGIWPPTRQMVSVGLQRFRLGRAPTMEMVAARVARALFPREEDSLLRDMTAQRIAANDPSAYRRATLAVVRYRPGAALRRIACPVLIMAGDSDQVVSRDYQARLRLSLPQAQWVTVGGGGHACNIDHAGEVNRAVLAFLEQVDGQNEGRDG